MYRLVCSNEKNYPFFYTLLSEFFFFGFLRSESRTLYLFQRNYCFFFYCGLLVIESQMFLIVSHFPGPFYVCDHPYQATSYLCEYFITRDVHKMSNLVRELT